MQVILFRHAQKGITPFDDPQLTEVGFEQAKNLCALVKKEQLPVPTHTWVSPKIRTSQTLKALCESFNVPMSTTEALDLRGAYETLIEFRNRVGKFLSKFEEEATKKPAEIHFICTHFDWIDEAMTLINSDRNLTDFEFSHWAPAQYAAFEISPQNSKPQQPWRFLQIGTAPSRKLT